MSEDRVVSLTGKPVSAEPQPQAEIVAILESVLERAKCGEVVGVGVALALANNDTFHHFVTGEYRPGQYCKYQLSHAISTLQHQFLSACADQIEELKR